MRATDQIKHFTLAFAFVLAMASFSQPAFGADTQSPSADTQPPSAEIQQVVQARAASLQTWREQCSDPDPDLRLAYVESAIANKDASVQRICIRLALQSDNSDIRNLGLRAAIAATQQITFMPTMPKSLEAELRKGADDENFMRKVKETYASRVYETTQNGLKMCPRRPDARRVRGALARARPQGSQGKRQAARQALPQSRKTGAAA